MSIKRTVIFGAGQGGRMVLKLLNGNNYEVVAFMDNNRSLYDKTLAGLPILSPEELKSLNPDAVFIAVLNPDRAVEIYNQLVQLGVARDKIRDINFARECFDIRLAVMRQLAYELIRKNIRGELAELGVYLGDFACRMNELFPDRYLYLFDTFTGFDQRDIMIEHAQGFSRAVEGKFSDTSREFVRSRLPYPEKAIFKQGYFPDTARGINEGFALVSIDADLYKPVYEGLKFFYPRLNEGGYLMIHDYDNSYFSGVNAAVRRYCDEMNLYLVPLCDLHGSAVMIKH
ncbi:MAG: TylF/MycF/NovP-related O-methyltransferase [Peptococcaceae bacterium]